jgi:hypothetical protein
VHDDSSGLRQKTSKEIQISLGPTSPVKCLPTNGNSNEPPTRGRSKSSDPRKGRKIPKEQQRATAAVSAQRGSNSFLLAAQHAWIGSLGFGTGHQPTIRSRLLPLPFFLPGARAGSHQTLGRQIRCDRPRWRPRRRPRGAAQGSGQGSGTSPAPPPGGGTGGWSWEPAAPSSRRPSATSSRKASATLASRTSAIPATATVSSRYLCPVPWNPVACRFAVP